MRSPQAPENGVVAILDALGASSYSDAEIMRFLQSRELVLRLLQAKMKSVIGSLRAKMIATFTFNDTIVIVLKSGNKVPQTAQIRAFHSLIRKFLIDSLRQRILFHGAVSIGNFYVNEETNTVMGQAVTDAAARYDKADWFGVHATPRASLLIEGLLSQGSKNSSHIVVDYSIPMKDHAPVCLKAVNWPKAFYVPELSPCTKGEKPRSKLLSLLSEHRVPRGVENKFFHSLEFFDFVVKTQKLEGE